MLNIKRNLSTKVTFVATLYLALTGVLLTSILYSSLNNLAETQLNELGNALSSQLSETLKQPVINNDIISTQVILDNVLADTPVIARATVYSTSNKILAQSQRPSPGQSLAPYIQPIRVDDNMLAQLRLELDEDRLLSEYRLPMWQAIATWFLLAASLAGYVMYLGRDYSRRIMRINASFTGNSDNGTELDQLEASLAPFINHHDIETVDNAFPIGFAMLAISIPNLPKWQAQLNAEHFTGMLRKVDNLLDNHLSLFKGERIRSAKTAMLVEFTQQSDEPATIRAIDCANAFLHLANRLVSAESIPFEIRITAAFRQPSTAGSPWFNDLGREECIERLLGILPLTGGWELVIDKEDLDEAVDLAHCQLEDLSAASVWQFKSYTGERQDNFYKQLQFLSSTL